ncbi:unnamed protein product [Boreogadus saida]
MIVYFAESRIADRLAEPGSRIADGLAESGYIAPTVSELSVNRTPSEINAVPICTVVQNGMSNRMVNRMTELSVTRTPSEINAVPICTGMRNCMANCMVNRMTELSVTRTPSEINAVPICTGMKNPTNILLTTNRTPPEMNTVPTPRTVSRCKTRRRGPRPVCRILAIPLIASEC